MVETGRWNNRCELVVALQLLTIPAFGQKLCDDRWLHGEDGERAVVAAQ